MPPVGLSSKLREKLRVILADAIGIISAITEPLVKEKISAAYLSLYHSDMILVEEVKLEKAREVISAQVARLINSTLGTEDVRYRSYFKYINSNTYPGLCIHKPYTFLVVYTGVR